MFLLMSASSLAWAAWAFGCERWKCSVSSLMRIMSCFVGFGETVVRCVSRYNKYIGILYGSF